MHDKRVTIIVEKRINTSNGSIFSQEDKVNNRQKLIGIMFVLLMFFGTLVNSLVTFYAVPRLQTPVNILIMGCVGFDV